MSNFNFLKKNLYSVNILVILFSLLDKIESGTTESVLGTNLPTLTSSSRHRVFNDLFKQSTEFNSYNPNNFGRQWHTPVSLGSDLYPSYLNTTQVAGAKINLYNETDTGLLQTNITCSFDGDGQVLIYQEANLLLNLNTSNNTYNFILTSLDPLMVYITWTNVTNLVRNIQIIPTSIYNNSTILNKTFNQNFLSVLDPFDLIRFCYWQGQTIYAGNYPILWQNRVTNTSASQVSSNFGISLEHILELTNLLNVIPFFCIPQKSDDNYIAQMAILIRENLPVDTKIYLEYGNAYTVMNKVPYDIISEKFSLFLNNYGTQYRDEVVFSLNYLNAQYFINAIGGQSTPEEYNYIDCIGVETSFATDLNIFNAYNVTDSELENLIINQQLETEVLINRAYVFAKRIGKELISFQGNPHIKPPRYGQRHIYDFLKNQTAQNLIYKNQEIQLSSDLHAFHNNTFVKDIFYNWLIRLRNIGLKTIISPILVDPFTDNRDFVPLLENLSNTNSNFYQAFVAFNNNETCPIALAVIDIEVPCNMTCLYGDCINNTCLCYEGYEGDLCDTKSSNYISDCNKFIGVNLDGNAYWTTQMHFVDVMKTSSAWILRLPWGGWSSAQNLLNTIDFDEQDYPITLPPNIFAQALMVRDLDTHYEAGTYTVLYDGDGTLGFGMDVVKVKRFVGRIYIDVVPQTQLNNGIVVAIERSNPEDPIHNIRVIRPGFEHLYKKLIFHPMFLSQLKPFGVIRFMDFFATNSQTDQEWSSRTLEGYRTYTKNGAPIETMIKLSNKSGKDMWINVPHLADDDYILNMANMIYNNLRPDLKLYVEYSNEVWGNLFPGGIYAQEQGLKMDLSTDPTEARFCYLGYMTNKISEIFRGVFSASGNGDEKTRLKIVVSTQAVNADTTKRILACQNTYQNVDAVAIAPYFSVPLEDSYTVDDIFNIYIPQNFNQTKTYLQEHYAFAQQYNLEFYNYESGQGFVGNNKIQTNLQISIQNDPRMSDVYVEYLKILKSNGVSLTNLFVLISSWSKYGSWGHLRYHDVQKNDSMKFRGVMDYLENQSSCSFNYEDFSQCQVNSTSGLDTCNNQGVCFLDSCYCHQNFFGKYCETQKFIDYFYCGYKCNFDNGVCVIKYIVDSNRYWGCVCNPGYKGSDCSIPICTSECSYNGICVSPNKCNCFPGRKGVNCEIDCGCEGHGVCDTSSNRCLCDTGFTYDNSAKKCLPLCNTPSGDATTSNCDNPNDLRCGNNLNGNACSNNGKCYNGQCSCFTGFTGINCEFFSTGNNSIVSETIMPLGINLGGLSYWSTQFLFKNYFYQSSSFISNYYPNYYNSTIQYTWNTGQPFPTLPNGYPKSLQDDQIVVKLLLRDIQLRYPKSLDFLLLYDGDGYIELGMDASVKNITNRRAGRIEFTAVPSTELNNGIYVQILKTNPSNPVTNIRIINKADEFNYEKEFITDSFSEFIKQFSTIRFMDIMNTNGNNMISVEDETHIDQDTQAEAHGVNSDILINIFKYSGKNPWICIPHMVDDNYVRYLATKLKNELPKHLKIYIEYSNEVWNLFFPQGKYAQTQASILGLENYHKFYAKRSLEIFNIFKDVFGTSEKYRLKFVISTQIVNTWVTQQILSYGNITQTVHILAVGAYYDCNGLGNNKNAPLTAIKTVDQIIQICKDSLSSMDEAIASQYNIAKQYNLTLTAYECGTSISEEQPIYNGVETPGLTKLLIAVNRDPRMKEIYYNLLKRLSDNKLINMDAPAMIFSSIGLPSKYGSWGVLDYSDQVYESPSHPKFEAIKQFNNIWISELYGNCSLNSSQFIDPARKSCVNATNCSASNPYGDPSTNICVNADNCSSENPYGDPFTRLCTNNCSSNNPYADPSTNLCTSKCSQGNPYADRIKKICVTQSNCSKPNIYADPGTNSCISSCPLGYFSYLTGCLASCPDSNQVDMQNKICYNCGLTQSYFYQNRCVNQCPNYSAPDPTGKQICIQCSTVGMYWFQGKCVNTVPAGTIKIDASSNAYVSCIDVGQYLYNNACVLECPSPHLSDQNNTCVVNWAENGKYLHNNTVFDACPSGYTSNKKRICYSCSVLGLLYYNSKCVRSCPSNYIITDEYICDSCSSNSEYYLDGECVDTCPFGATLRGNKCLCANNTVYNSVSYTCSPACSSGLGYYQLNNTCIECSSHNTFTYNLLCVDECPVNTFVDNVNHICVDIPQSGSNLFIDTPTSCNPNPCNNNSTCSIVNSLVVCNCVNNFYGKFCDVSSQEVSYISNRFQTLFTGFSNSTRVDNSTLQNIESYTNFISQFPEQKNSSLTQTVSEIISKI